MKITVKEAAKRLFSAPANTNLAREETVKNLKHPHPSAIIQETPSVTITNNNLDQVKSNKFVQLAQSRAAQTTHQLNYFIRGPVRSNFLVSLELMKMIAVEQKFLPDLDTWPQARFAYISVFESFKTVLKSGQLGKFLVGRFNEMTWGQVGRALRVTAEMAAFYYIGQVIGMIASFPFK